MAVAHLVANKRAAGRAVELAIIRGTRAVPIASKPSVAGAMTTARGGSCETVAPLSTTWSEVASRAHIACRAHPESCCARGVACACSRASKPFAARAMPSAHTSVREGTLKRARNSVVARGTDVTFRPSPKASGRVEKALARAVPCQSIKADAILGAAVARSTRTRVGAVWAEVVRLADGAIGLSPEAENDVVVARACNGRRQALSLVVALLALGILDALSVAERAEPCGLTNAAVRGTEVASDAVVRTHAGAVVEALSVVVAWRQDATGTGNVAEHPSPACAAGAR